MKNIINLLLFQNRKGENNARYFFITDGVMWRRDEQRLVAYQLKGGSKGNWQYEQQKLEGMEECSELSVDETGLITLSTKKGVEMIAPMKQVPTDQAFRALSVPSNDVVFSLPAKAISKQLSIFQRKIMREKKDLNASVLVLDLENGTISIEGMQEIKKIEMKIAKKGHTTIIRYSYAFFKDLFINASVFNEEIICAVQAPYYTVATYDEQTFSILMHKKE